jgi:hypothetical protein
MGLDGIGTKWVCYPAGSVAATQLTHLDRYNMSGGRVIVFLHLIRTPR